MRITAAPRLVRPAQQQAAASAAVRAGGAEPLETRCSKRASRRACTTRRGSTLQSAHAVPASAQCMPPKARQRAQSWMRPEPLNASSATSKRRAMPKPGPPQALLVPNDSWPQRCCAGGALRRRARVRCSSSASILRCAAAGAASSAHVGCTARRAAAGSARPTDGAWPRQAHGARRGCKQKQAAPNSAHAASQAAARSVRPPRCSVGVRRVAAWRRGRGEQQRWR